MDIKKIIALSAKIFFGSTIAIAFFYCVLIPGIAAPRDYSALKTNPSDTKLRIKHALDLLEQENYRQAQVQLKAAYDFDRKNVYLNALLTKQEIIGN